MKFLFIMVVIVVFPLYCHAAPPAPDLFADYNKSIQSEADAKNINMLKAWSSNIENLVKSKHKKGIVVNGECDNELYSSDALGNITIKEGADVGVIINNTTIDDSNVIINKRSKF